MTSSRWVPAPELHFEYEGTTMSKHNFAGQSVFITGAGTALAPFLKRVMSRSLFRSVLRSEARKIGYL
jgi:hypothetical protein